MIQVGDVFNRLEVIEINVEPPKEKKYAKKLGKWCRCRCKCKNIIVVPEASLLNKSTQSCGCLRAEIAKEQLKMNRKNGIKVGAKGYKLTHNDETKSLTEWANDIGITKQALSKRLKTLSLEEALTKEVKKNGN